MIKKLIMKSLFYILSFTFLFSLQASNSYVPLLLTAHSGNIKNLKKLIQEQDIKKQLGSLRTAKMEKATSKETENQKECRRLIGLVKFLQEQYRQPIETQQETITTIQKEFGITLTASDPKLAQKKKKKKRPENQAPGPAYTEPTYGSKARNQKYARPNLWKEQSFITDF